MNKELVDWIIANGSSLLNLLLAVLAIVIAVIQNWTSVKAKAFEGIAMAKKLAKDNVLASGQEQEDWVVRTVYPLLPAQVKVFISEAIFRTIVQKLYKAAKESIATIDASPAEGGGA